MPANLNALIRYKTIDQCLKNKYVPCTIERLQDACSDALGESRGRYTTVSIRTLYDDIHIMRSDILGFNAPIICSNGIYSYEDDGYSIFEVKIRDIDLLKKVAYFLVKHQEIIKHEKVHRIISEIEDIVSQETKQPFLAEKEVLDIEREVKETEARSKEGKRDDFDLGIQFSIVAKKHLIKSGHKFKWSNILSMIQ